TSLVVCTLTSTDVVNNYACSNCKYSQYVDKNFCVICAKACKTPKKGPLKKYVMRHYYACIETGKTCLEGEENAMLKTPCLDEYLKRTEFSVPAGSCKSCLRGKHK
ncbi:hypothetical protein L9F63_018221, partial [Diploptera punctata]